MKCFHCGCESEENLAFCPNCGLAPQPNAVAQVSAADRLLQALKDTLFLLLCIAMSASCILSITAGNLPLISILITVFLWLTYAQAKKDVADAQHLRCVSGAVYAQYVITYVLAGLIVLLGIIFAVAFSALASDPEFLSALLSGFGEFDGSYLSMTSLFTAVGGGVIAVICIVVAAIVVVINIFSTRYIHRFAKSVYQSIETGVLELKHTKAVKIWLCILGGFSVINALSSLGDGNIAATLTGVVDGVCAIIPVLLISKYLSDK